MLIADVNLTYTWRGGDSCQLILPVNFTSFIAQGWSIIDVYLAIQLKLTQVCSDKSLSLSLGLCVSPSASCIHGGSFDMEFDES